MQVSHVEKNMVEQGRGTLIFRCPNFGVIFRCPLWKTKGKLISEGPLGIKMGEIGHCQQDRKHIFQMRPFLAQ